MIIEVPWKVLPISEPVLPGEESEAARQAGGFPVYAPALVSIAASITTSEARRLVEAGRVRIDGEVTPATFIYIRAGALIDIGTDTSYRIGPPDTDARGRSA